MLTHVPTGVKSEANERRSQHENHRVALQRLRVNLALAVRGEWASEEREEAEVSERWRRRSGGGRIVVSPTHEDFAPLLAEALDAIERHRFDVAAAAGWLGVSSSQLVKLLRVEPRALKQVNDRRSELGMKPLR